MFRSHGKESRLSDRRSITDWEARAFCRRPTCQIRVSLLRWKLGRKAKQEPSFGSTPCRTGSTGATSWRRRGGGCGRTGSAGCRWRDVARHRDSAGRCGRFLDDLAEALRTRTYRPQPVRRVYIPEAGRPAPPVGHSHGPGPRGPNGGAAGARTDLRGGLRGVLLRLPSGRNAHQALDQMQAALKAGRQEVYDADLASYFDTIDHARLLQHSAADHRPLGAAADRPVAAVPGRRGRRPGATTHRRTRGRGRRRAG